MDVDTSSLERKSKFGFVHDGLRCFVPLNSTRGAHRLHRGNEAEWVIAVVSGFDNLKREMNYYKSSLMLDHRYRFTQEILQ